MHVGTIFTFDSTIGRVAKVAIEAARDDVNANPTVLAGTRLDIEWRDTNCSGFLGMMEGDGSCLSSFAFLINIVYRS